MSRKGRAAVERVVCFTGLHLENTGNFWETMGAQAVQDPHLPMWGQEL